MNKETYDEIQNCLKNLLTISFEKLQNIPDKKTHAYKKGVLDCKSVLKNYFTFQHQPTLDECIKIWENNGWTIVEKEQTILYLIKPNHTCYTYPTNYYISFYIRNEIQFSTNCSINVELLNLLYKTLKALEVKNGKEI